MSIARDRANRSGTDPLQIDNTKLITDSGDLKVQDTSGNEKKLIADEIHVGTGSDKVILKRDSSTGKVAIQTQASGEAAQGGTVASTTVYATTALLPTSPSDGEQALVTANNFLYIAKSNGWYKIAEITNTTPTISSAGDASYTFLTDGTPVSIEITATDAEVGTALQYKYVVSSGSIGSSATVTSSATSGGTYSALAANTLTTNKFFKVTPSTNSAHAGTFSLTFSASDGVAVATSSASEFTLAFSVSGSYKFDETGDYILTPVSSDFTIGTNDFTIEYWAWNRDFNTAQTIADRQHGTSGDLLIGTNGSGQHRLYANGAYRILTAATPAKTWNHVAIQRSSNVTKMYANGKAAATSYSDTNNYPGTKVTLGMLQSLNGEGMDGYISNYREVIGSTVYTPSTTGAGLDFGSSNSTLTTTASHSGFDFGSNNFTIEFFYKWSTNNDYQTLLDHQYNAADGVTIQSDTNTYKWGFFGSGLSLVYESSDATVGVWHHYAVVRNGNVVKMYRDGVETLSQSKTGTVGGTDATTFGGVVSQNDHYDFGKVSNFRVVKGTALYTGAFTPPTAPLAAISGTSLLLFRENSGSTLTDGSSNNVTITKGSGHTILANDGPTYGDITVPTSPLTAITNTKLLTLTEAESSSITNGSYYVGSTSNSHVTTSTSTDFTLGTNNDFTVEFWYKFGANSISNGGYLFDMGSNTFTVYASSTSVLSVWGAGGTVNNGGSNVGTSTKVWHHMVVQRAGNVHTFYINGQLQSSKTDSGNVHNFNGNYLRIGNYGGGNGGPYGQNAYYSDFRFVKGTAVYSGNFTPPSGPLTLTGGTYPSNTNVNTSIPSGHTKLLTANHSSGSYDDDSNSNHTLTAAGTVSLAGGIEGSPADLSSSSHSLSLNGDATHSYASPFAQGVGGSVLFDGTDDYLTVASSSNFALGTGDFTIEMWVYFTDTSLESSVNRRIFCLDDGGNAVDNLQIVVDNGGYTTDGSLFLYSNGFKGNLSTNIKNGWYHIAVVRNSGTLKFYLDGVEKDSNSNTQDYSPNSGSPTPVIGTRGDNKGDYNGYISNLRIVKGTAVYTSNFTVPTSKLTAVTNTILLTCNDSNAIDDASTLSNTITVNGDAIATRFNPF